MRKGLGFSPSLLEAFERSKEPFIVYKGRLYTVDGQTERNPRNKLLLGKEAYDVFPANTLIELRNEQFAKHQEELKDYMNWVVSFKIMRRVNDLSEQLDRNIDYYGQLQKDRIKAFMLDVFDQFNHRRDRHVLDSKADQMPEAGLDLDALDGLPDPFDSCVPKPGMVALGGWAYALKLPTNGSRRDYRLAIGGNDFDLDHYSPLRDVILHYDAKIRGLIESTAMQQGKQLSGRLSQMKHDKEALTALLQRHQHISLNRRDGDISYRRVKDDQYRITVDIPPFLFEKDGKYYAFGTQRQDGGKQVKLALDLTIDERSLIFNEEPKVITTPYFHPFVFESGSICYKGNAGDRWREHGIAFSQRYSLDTPGLARKVMLALQEGRSSITNGFLGTQARPVHGFDNFTPVAYDLGAAKAYARAEGIDEKRIFRN